MPILPRVLTACRRPTREDFNDARLCQQESRSHSFGHAYRLYLETEMHPPSSREIFPHRRNPYEFYRYEKIPGRSAESFSVWRQACESINAIDMNDQQTALFKANKRLFSEPTKYKREYLHISCLVVMAIFRSFDIYIIIYIYIYIYISEAAHIR